MIIQAARYAFLAHEGQLRKYTGRPYIEHPMRVAGRVTTLPDVLQEFVAAAWLHDVVEDCKVSPATLRGTFSTGVCDLVCELTNPSKKLQHLDRAARKAQDREHIGRASYWGQIIKLVDRIDNLREMGNDPEILKMYGGESLELLKVIRETTTIQRMLKDELRELAEAMI